MRLGNRLFLSLLFLFLVSAVGILLPVSAAAQRVEFILDGSGSMWGRVGDETKIEVAKRVMTDLVNQIELPQESSLGLTVYGHRKKGDCQDIEHYSTVSYAERTQLLPAIEGISPKGKTPIADTLHTVGESLKAGEGQTSIVLVTDGIESCGKDPCQVAQQLREQYGIEVEIHVVGFGVEEGQEQLKCIAREGGGRYFDPGDEAELVSALTELGDVIAKPEPVVEPEPEPEPAKPRQTSAAGSPLSAIIVEPLTLDGFPKIAEVYVLKPGTRRDWGGMSPVKRSTQLGKKMIVPAGTYDIAFKPAGGRSSIATTLIAGLEVPTKQTVTVHTNNVAAGIRVPNMEGVEHKGIYITKAGGRRDSFMVVTHKGYVEAAESFGPVMMVTADHAYDVLLDLGDENLLPIAENVTPGSGELLVIGEEENGQSGSGSGGSSDPFSGAKAGN